MSPKPRVKRVPPEQIGPIRNSLARDRATSAPRPAWTPNGVLRDALECGVQTAYAVIDEYMQRGYQAARLNQNPPNSKGNMSNDRPNFGNFSNPWGPMAPLMEQWSAAFRAWTDAMSAFVPGSRPGAWPGQTWTAGAAGYSAAAPSPAVSVEVSSLRPTEVTVNLKPTCDLTGLVADSFVPHLLKTVSITQKGTCVRVSVHVAREQLAGRYSGVIRSADGSIAGDLTIVISESAEPHA
jgi:hypothetical protein